MNGGPPMCFVKLTRLVFVFFLVLGSGGGLFAQQWDAVMDGGFEEGSPNPFWLEEGEPSIMMASTLAHSGDWLAAMGSDAEAIAADYFLYQDLDMGSGGSTLKFWWRWASSSGAGEDYLRVWIDDQVVFEQYADTFFATANFEQASIDLPGDPDGLIHELLFELHSSGDTTTDAATLVLVDDVELMTWDSELLTADFFWNPEIPGVDEPVQFTDVSTGNPDNWEWDFGDGTRSTEQNPIHTFRGAGEYDVVLTVGRSADGDQDWIDQIVTVGEDLSAEFSWDPGNPEAGTEVFFSNESRGGPDSFSWDFGDGFTSEEENPTHVWDNSGVYTVSLEVYRSSDGAWDYVEHEVPVGRAPGAEFSWDPWFPSAGEEVYFSNETYGNVIWSSWDFGDGSNSGESDPVHIFVEAGDYQVSLTVGILLDSGATAEGTVSYIVSVGGTELDPWFDWDPWSPAPGEQIEFRDQSEGSITEWSWDFGDGSVGSGDTVVHSYENAGSYIVSLVIRDAAGNTAATSQIIEVGEIDYWADFYWDPEIPAPGEMVEFFDLSEPQALSWSWDFGDGSTSTEQNPSHQYDAEGVYTVTLEAGFDEGGALVDTFSYELEVASAYLEADFLWAPMIPLAEEDIEFWDLSGGEVESWFWDFGDGSTSTEQDPIHSYSLPGDYDVSLRVEGAGTSDEVMQTISIIESVDIDFSWDPGEPRAWEGISFFEDVDEEAPYLFWSFGDGEISEESEPIHVYDHQGRFTVQLWVADSDGDVFASVEHQLDVAAPEVDLELDVSEENPEIGEEVDFQINSSVKDFPTLEAVEWNFGGAACDSSPRILTCTPSDGDDCLSRSFRYSSFGLKGVRVMLQISGSFYGPLTSSVEVQDNGSCGEGPEADFVWWPSEPMEGQRVRCVDTSGGAPEHWRWTFDDGSISNRQHPVKIFSTAGEHQVKLEISSPLGQSTLSRSISVRAVQAECGNTICEPGESAWSCPGDCGNGRKNATGRTGRKDTSFAIPAAAGGIAGANGTQWLTEATIINPGDGESGVIVEFFPDARPDSSMIAGPTIMPPRTAVHFENLVTELFGVHELGGIWIDSSRPVIVNTRTYNQTSSGTLGQAIGGISEEDILGAGDGRIYLLGLSQNQNFRTNILLQEVSGHQASVKMQFFGSDSTALKTVDLSLEPDSRWQKQLPALGINSLEDGYAVISVTRNGHIAVLASKVDQRSGDATTIDPIHRLQMDFGSDSKAENVKEHFLVAVVARNVGANQTLWRSELSILNPDTKPETVELRYVPSSGGMKSVSVEIGPGAVFATPDVLANEFPEVGNDNGALHIYSEKALAVSSRTYNLLPTDATVGQSIPGLAEGDMARPGEVWLLDSLRDDADYRCNVGFAEFEGNDAQITLVLFDTSAMAQRYLGYRVYNVQAFSQLQINRVFEDFGISGDIPQAIGYLSVSSENGAIYGYASIVDNAIGDGTTILAKRQ